MSLKWVLYSFLTWASPLFLSILFVELLLSIFVCSLWSVFSRLVGFPLVVLMFCYWKKILLHFVHLQEDSIYQVLVHWLKIEQIKSNFVSVCNLVIFCEDLLLPLIIINYCSRNSLLLQHLRLKVNMKVRGIDHKRIE